MSHSKTLTPEVLVPRVGEYLVENGYISSDNVQSALGYQSSFPKDEQPLLGQILVEQGALSKQDLDHAITELIFQLRNALQTANAELEQRVGQRTIELQEALNKLSELDQLKANFVSNISHELRTPMTHIKGYLGLLAAEDLGPLVAEQKDALGVMDRASNRLEKLINDLILFASLQPENINLQMTSVDLIRLFSDTMNHLQPNATDKSINLICDCPQNLPLVEADEDKINWVIQQLLDNAIKFTPNGGSVTLKAANFKDNFVQLAISDTGIGIPKDRIPEIFQPFHQLEGQTTRRFGGTGIGLTLAQDFIKAHGSRLSVFSEFGKGSTFTFCLKQAK